jgi:Sulfotransferase domain
MPLAVMGAGFGRTGTLSLKLALEQLGFGPCCHMLEIFRDQRQVPAWDAVADGGPADWEALYSGYRSAVDWPGVNYWRDIARAFPLAKVVLTVRDPLAWVDSTRKTVFAMRFSDPATQLGQLNIKHIRHLYELRDDTAALVAAFDQHNEAVQREIPAERLLVYDVAEGWEPLCAFLDVPVPEAPMPRLNSTESFGRDMFRILCDAGPLRI